MTHFPDLPKTGPQEQSKIALCIKYPVLATYYYVVILLNVKLIRARVPEKAGSPFWAVMGSKVGPYGPNFFCKLVGAIGRVWPSGPPPPMATNPGGGGGGGGGNAR